MDQPPLDPSAPLESLPQLLTVSQCAAYLGCSPRTVERWKDSGRLPFVKLGRKLTRVRRADLEAFIERSSVDVNAPWKRVTPTPIFGRRRGTR